MNNRLALWLPAALALGFATAGAAAQNYPVRPVRIVTSAIGGGNDFNARLVAQGLTEIFQQQFVVDNRGGSYIAPNLAAKATPDGYTLLVHNNGVWTAPLLDKVPYDFDRELTPVVIVSRSPNILVVHPSLGVASVKELIALAKANPGKLNYATGVVGSSNHVAAELFRAMTHVDMVRIGYRGSGPALIDMVSGQVKLMFATAGAATPHVRSGRLKALAVSSAAPSKLAPDLPTIAASGVPGYESEAIYGLWVPAGTPGAIAERLNREVIKAINEPRIRQRFLNGGGEVAGSTPAQFAATIKAEHERIAQVFRRTGVLAR